MLFVANPMLPEVQKIRYCRYSCREYVVDAFSSLSTHRALNGFKSQGNGTLMKSSGAWRGIYQITGIELSRLESIKSTIAERLVSKPRWK